MGNAHQAHAHEIVDVFPLPSPLRADALLDLRRIERRVSADVFFLPPAPEEHFRNLVSGMDRRGLARSERFELPTPRFEVWCSIQLSYERASPNILAMICHIGHHRTAASLAEIRHKFHHDITRGATLFGSVRTWLDGGTSAGFGQSRHFS
jgi:hypothetical protein